MRFEPVGRSESFGLNHPTAYHAAMSDVRRRIRELALQALYQYDARQGDDAAEVERTVLDAPGDERAKQPAIELARQAWAAHTEADAMAGDLAADWPTHRQPVVDRCILRLAYYEMAHGQTPPRVAINEAIELAKTFGSERSPDFINGVLDKMMKRLAASPVPPRDPGPADPWLADALGEEH